MLFTTIFLGTFVSRWGNLFAFVAPQQPNERIPRLPNHLCRLSDNDCRGTSRPFPLAAETNENNDEAYDDDDDVDDDPPEVDVRNFRPPTASFGLYSGRSSPSQRKGMGLSRSSTAKVFLCTNCGSEFVKWMGRCPTCKEWNTLQEHVVTRQSVQDPAQPWFGEGNLERSSYSTSSAWLPSNSPQSMPIKIGNIFQQEREGDCPRTDWQRPRRSERILVPNDDELNNVLGGGFFPGSLILIGGSPGVGKSTLLLQTAASFASLATPQRGIGMGRTNEIDQDNMYGAVWYGKSLGGKDYSSNKDLPSPFIM